MKRPMNAHREEPVLHRSFSMAGARSTAWAHDGASNIPAPEQSPARKRIGRCRMFLSIPRSHEVVIHDLAIADGRCRLDLFRSSANPTIILSRDRLAY